MARTQIDASLVPTAQKLSQYKRPQLGFGGVTAVGIDTYRTDGVNNYAQIIFPDGQWREESNSTRRTFIITRNAVLTNSGAQSGLRTSLSEATNTWYALYAVKISDSASGFVVVGDTTLPLMTSVATLNAAYGTNSWVYLGMIRNGDNAGATGDILNFYQAGNLTVFRNAATGNIMNGCGLRLATSAGATALTYTYSAGTGTTAIPDHIFIGDFMVGANAGSGTTTCNTSGNTMNFYSSNGTTLAFIRFLAHLTEGARLTNGSSVAMDIFLVSFVDPVLGVGANPLI